MGRSVWGTDTKQVRRSRSKIKKAAGIAAVLYLIAVMLLNPSESIQAAKKRTRFMHNALIPSLFPFFVFSSLLIQFGFARMLAKPMSHIMRPLFGVSGSGALCFILGI